jgi:glucose-6-phosphate isomerase
MQISVANHIKKKNNYRHGGQSRHCSYCNSFKTVQISGIGGADLGTQPRCEWIGMDSGKNYKINPEYICDLYDNSIQMARYNR